MEIKYTSDGKKVAIVGKLNAQETIVQEIFVIGEAELPSGENFVVKSLHDAPVISWKEKELKRLDERYESEKRDLDNKIRAINDSYKNSYAKMRAVIEYNAEVIKNINPAMFDHLIMWICGEIKYFVEEGYSPKIMEYDGFFKSDYYGGKYDSMQLLSIFGNSKGDFKYRVNDYSDGSGNYHTIVTPFRNYTDAFEYFKSIIQTSEINDHIYAQAKKHKIKLDGDKVKKYKSNLIATHTKSIENHLKDIERYKAIIKDIEKK